MAIFGRFTQRAQRAVAAAQQAAELAGQGEAAALSGAQTGGGAM